MTWALRSLCRPSRRAHLLTTRKRAVVLPAAIVRPPGRFHRGVLPCRYIPADANSGLCIGRSRAGHRGLGGRRPPTSGTGYIPVHCLLLLSTPIKEGCKLSAMMVYFAHANSTNKNSDSAVSGKKCRNEILDKIYHRFYSVDAPVCFRLF